MNEATLQRMILAIAVLLASLSLVAWRQGRALGVLSELDTVRSEVGIARSHVGELNREIRGLQSRARIVDVAKDRLGLRPPDDQVRVLRMTER
ncbi:MAG TPA: hypothetical protein VK858_16430 [Longimicrobiales bacterium]|nr:hypothetical protein [Longimicrobiales bacterium]